MFNPVVASQNIKDEFVGYIETLYNIADKEYSKQFSSALKENGAVTKGPYLDVSDSYKTGMSVAQLIKEGELSPLFDDLESNIPDGDKELQINRPLYSHQESAVRKINQGKNLIVTTGTGSGKTECFIIPIINCLLREAESGSLDSGVRAIIIYPMNALANDQMKRLRSLLKSFPDITFGVYNSSTKYTYQEGIVEYGKIYKDENGNPLKPLRNEMISREQMQQTPPHILVTNYAMLEYMMLRPKDDLVFSRAKLRFLVLDEAHIYRGATGMETSLLLKRLKARISNPSNVLHILTSATLGGEEANADIVKFGETLCNARFKEEDIIRAQKASPSFDKPGEDIPLSLFAELSDPQKGLNEIVQDYGMEIPEGKSYEEFLYDLCVSSSIYRELRHITQEPLTIPKITKKLNQKYNVSEQDVVNIIGVASQASKNKTSLIKARYHMFAKALEGAYITIGKNKKLILNRNTSMYINGDESKVFECAVCDDCGRIAVVGRVSDGKLEFANNAYDQDVEYFLLCDDRDNGEVIDDEDEYEDYTEEIGENDYLLCSKCGAVFHESLKNHATCSCGRENYVKVRKARKSATRNEGKCPSCGRGTFKTFYLGYDAATAVLGTSLFEELPENEKTLKTTKNSTETKRGLFTPIKPQPSVEQVKKERQFLAFSDSRSEAAFFATYMTESYEEFLRRRGIWHIVSEHREDMAAHPWEIKNFVDELTAYFDSERTFAEPGDNGSENLTATSRRNAWIAVLNEMVNARRSTSLVSLGVIKFQYKGNTEEIMEGVAYQYGESIEDMKALFDLLVMDIVYHGALEGDCNLTDDDREYIFYSTKPKRVKFCKDSDRDKKKAYLMGWIASCRKNGKLQKNGRLCRIMDVLKVDEKEANEILQEYWDQILCSNTGLSSSGNNEFYFSTDRFTISAVAEDTPIYKCDVCGRTSTVNCKGKCPTLKCNGHLRPVKSSEIQRENHYAKLYQSSLMKPLHIKEHTAQLGREEQQKYQEMFVNKEINALSCSTTFELGVDVGDLETVYLRNMPPSPANYAQRAGRAGRGKNAAAFALTYAKLGSHDFTYFKNPENMITGKIGVPLFTVKNEKVILRHIFAVALSEFFANNEDVYNSNDADIFLNQNGWERLCSYLSEEPEHLKNLLKSSIPEDMHETMGINDYSWAEKLIGEEGTLKVAVDDFRSTVKYYQEEEQRLLKQGHTQEAAAVEKKLQTYRKGKQDHTGRNELIEFLVRNNVLPKYGFPVDTVELYQNVNVATDNKLQMSRDLQMAVAEYAPDSQVVADGKLYTSRYIRKSPQKNGGSWESAFIAQCKNPSCQTWNYSVVEPGEEGKPCVSCNEMIERSLWHQAIEPRKGFIAEPKPRAVPMRKPDRTYKSEDYYIGDTNQNTTQKYAFTIENEKKVQMETSVNDSLMVVCNDNFYVCPQCGYAESTTENMDKAHFNSHQKIIVKKHFSPWEKECSGNLEQNKLCHVFKTDVVRLLFPTPQAGRQDVMLSVMYALLEAMSSVLDIERNDIKGCLHKVRYENDLIYSIVLYDAVAGGAGHVRRIVTDDGSVFQKVVEKAIEITKDCNCYPSCYNCLRNYYNQSIHDLLNREYAYKFLEDYLGDMSLEGGNS